jgi:hypothetical protein
MHICVFLGGSETVVEDDFDAQNSATVSVLKLVKVCSWVGPSVRVCVVDGTIRGTKSVRQ